MSWHIETDEYGREIEVDDYDEDESYPAEDELCDCGRYHFGHCYNIGCFGDLASRIRWDDDESDDEDDERSDDEPSSNSSDIPFYYPLSENPDITPKGDILS